MAAAAEPAVLLLHGSGPGTTAAAWAPLIEALAPRFETIAPDLPGFGAAPPAPIEEWAGILAPDRPCAVIGNSAGGALALRLAATRPELVTKVVAVGSMGYPMPLPAGLDRLWGAAATEQDARALLTLLFHAPQSEEAVGVGALPQARHPPNPPALPPPRPPR